MAITVHILLMLLVASNLLWWVFYRAYTDTIDELIEKAAHKALIEYLKEQQ